MRMIFPLRSGTSLTGSNLAAGILLEGVYRFDLADGDVLIEMC